MAELTEEEIRRIVETEVYEHLKVKMERGALSDAVKDTVETAVSNDLENRELPESMKFRLVKAAATATVIASTFVGVGGWALLTLQAEREAGAAATKAVQGVVANTVAQAKNVAREVAREEALNTSTFVSTSRAANRLLENEEFRREVIDQALRAFNGAVVAFDKECPEILGWKPFKPATARFIIGAGDEFESGYGNWTQLQPDGSAKTIELGSYTLRENGGVETVALSGSQIPQHQHSDDQAKFRINKHGDGWSVLTGSASQHNWKAEYGPGDEHNNMPPYIALYFCKKEAG